MDEQDVRLLLLVASFWVAVLTYAASGGRGRWAGRFIVGLGLGAVLTHLVWVLLRPGLLAAQPSVLWNPTLGTTILAVPLGLLLTAPGVRPQRARAHYLAISMGSLPLAFAMARLGCLVASCCHGIPTDLPWGIRLAGSGAPVHPTPLYEITGYVALFAIVQRLPRSYWAGAVLVGFGLIRLAVSPWRADVSLGDPIVSSSWLAALWIPVGLWLTPLPQHLSSRRVRDLRLPSPRPRSPASLLGSRLARR